MDNPTNITHLWQAVTPQLKRGRRKKYNTPAELWEACSEYFKWCDANPWMKVEQRKNASNSVVLKLPSGKAIKDIQELMEVEDLSELTMQPNDGLVYVPTSRPYNLYAMLVFIGLGRNTFRNYEMRPNFKEICDTIRSVIFVQKYEGAAVGAFNPQIMARDLMLEDNGENTAMSPEPASILLPNGVTIMI